METEKRIEHNNYVKLLDILNSQESIAEKVGVIQVELFNHPDAKLEKELNTVATLVADAYTKINNITQDYKSTHQISDDV